MLEDNALGPRRADLTHAVDEARQATAAPPRTPTHPSDEADRTAASFKVFESLLESAGLRAAMHSLLLLTDYRFISVFRFKEGMATSAVHVDREDLTITRSDEVADTATYCCFVRDHNGAFVTADAMLDARTREHPARAAIRGYCGIPILDPEGGLIGTLCHYDVMPRDPAQLDLELLLQAASSIARSGQVPPYPEPEPVSG